MVTGVIITTILSIIFYIVFGIIGVWFTIEGALFFRKSRKSIK